MADRKVCLGDSVYYEATYEGVLLTTENGVSTSNRIYLGDRELVALLRTLGEDFDKDKLCSAIRTGKP